MTSQDPSSSAYNLFGPDDEGDDQSRAMAQVISPRPAASLVPPPPDAPPASSPGQGTPLTGSLNTAPRESIAKNLDTPQGRTAYNTSPAQPIGGVAPAVRPMQSSVAPALPTASSVQPAQMNPDPNGSLRPGGSSSPMATASSSVPRVVIRDLNGKPAGSPLSALPASLAASASTVPPAASTASSVQPYQPGVPLAMQQARRVQAYNAGPGPAQYAARMTPVATDPNNPDPTTSLRPGGNPVMPAIPPGQTQPVNAPSQLDRDQARLAYLTNSGSGVSQIKNRFGRVAAGIGDAALSDLAPGVAQWTPGTTLNHQRLVGQQQQVVGNEIQQADTASQMDEREAQGRRADAQANYYNPEPLSAGQAQAMGHPEWEGLKLDARDAERLVGGAARNQTTLQTHFGGQQRTLSADDAEAIRTPSLEGASMSNDEYQRLLQGAQHNQQWDTNSQRTTGQSDINNRRNNETRITTTGMRDDTSEENSNRAHPGGGAGKPIPAGVRDRIESQKQIALNKARASFDSGESSMDDYLDNWQQVQNDYEGRIEAQTGQPVQHLDVRSNVDAKGNWVGKQPAAAQPQTQTSKPGSFTTRGGNRVKLGDPVKVGRRTGTVSGFNAQTGKAQVKWDGN